jgi:hypothetical protein
LHNFKSRPEDKNTLLNKAVKLHDLGIKGDKEAVTTAYKLFKELSSTYPQDTEIKAYFGSITSLAGRDAVNPTQQFKLTMKGLKLLDSAVSSEPRNIKIRLMRGNVCFRIPEMYFHRMDTAIEDFRYLIWSYEQNGSVFEKEQYLQLLFDLGKAYKEQQCFRGAKVTWQKLLSKTSDTKFRKLIKMEESEEDEDEELDGLLGYPKDELKLQKRREEDIKEEEDSNLRPSRRQENSREDEFNNKESDEEEEKIKKLLREGCLLHSKAFMGDSKQVKAAYSFFEEAYSKYQYHTELMAYYADCISLTGREAKDPMTLFGSAIGAAKLFDKAVKLDPHNVIVRLLRAAQSFRLPEAFFKRTATAVKDFEYLIDRYESDNSVLPRKLYDKILYLLGGCYQRLGMEKEASVTWQKLLRSTRDSRYKELVKSQLPKDYNPGNMKGNERSLLNRAIQLHDMAAAGNKTAAKPAREIFEKLFEKNPEDPMLEGYLGSSIALIGRDSLDSNSMFGNAIKGLQVLKSALNKDPDNVKLRLLRAFVYYNLPDVFFHLTDKTSKEFKFLEKAYEDDNSVFSAETYYEILYCLGVCYERMYNLAKAKETWLKLIRVSKDKKYKNLLAGKLD